MFAALAIPIPLLPCRGRALGKLGRDRQHRRDHALQRLTGCGLDLHLPRLRVGEEFRVTTAMPMSAALP